MRLVVNAATGAISQALEYNERGEVLSDSSPGFQPFYFAGGLYDTDTKLGHFGARDYDPSIGRWTSKDPSLFNGGTTNLYEYANSDPMSYIDVDGLAPKLAFAGDSGGGGGGGAQVGGGGAVILFLTCAVLYYFFLKKKEN